METGNDETGEIRFESVWDESAPDFLSGTNTKTMSYSNDKYYINLFGHFERNLKESDFLIIIGYGFQDSGINNYLEKYFLSDGKQMVIIDPVRPNTNLIDKYSAQHIQKGVTQLTFDEYLRLIPEKLKTK